MHGAIGKMERWQLNPVINPDYLARQFAGVPVIGTSERGSSPR